MRYKHFNTNEKRRVWATRRTVKSSTNRMTFNYYLISKNQKLYFVLFPLLGIVKCMQDLHTKWRIFSQHVHTKTGTTPLYTHTTSPGSNTPQDTNCTATIQVRRTRHAGHCWRSIDELIRDVLLWIPTHGRAKAGRPARTYIQQLCEDTGCCPKDLPRAMNDREEWRERVRDIRATSAIWWWWWWYVCVCVCVLAYVLLYSSIVCSWRP